MVDTAIWAGTIAFCIVAPVAVYNKGLLSADGIFFTAMALMCLAGLIHTYRQEKKEKAIWDEIQTDIYWVKEW